jgi:hypothetical protein
MIYIQTYRTKQPPFRPPPGQRRKLTGVKPEPTSFSRCADTNGCPDDNTDEVIQYRLRQHSNLQICAFDANAEIKIKVTGGEIATLIQRHLIYGTPTKCYF